MLSSRDYCKKAIVNILKDGVPTVVKDEKGNIVCTPEIWDLLLTMVLDTSCVLEEVIVDIKDWFVNHYTSYDSLAHKINSIVDYVRENSKRYGGDIDGTECN